MYRSAHVSQCLGVLQMAAEHRPGLPGAPPLPAVPTSHVLPLQTLMNAP